AEGLHDRSVQLAGERRQLFVAEHAAQRRELELLAQLAGVGDAEAKDRVFGQQLGRCGTFGLERRTEEYEQNGNQSEAKLRHRENSVERARADRKEAEAGHS